MNYFHYEIERRARREFIQKTIGEGEQIALIKRKSKTSDRVRINCLSNTGVVTIYTPDWHIVTIYIANFSEACFIYEQGTGEKPNRALIEAFQLAQQYKELEP